MPEGVAATCASIAVVLAGIWVAAPGRADASDGGRWVVESSGTSQDLTGVSFSDASHGWVVGRGGVILRTVNGGVTWSSTPACGMRSPCSPSARLSADLAGVSFPDDLHGWAVGTGGRILATNDGGRTWAMQIACATVTCGPAERVTEDLTGVSFADTLHGWAVGRGGVVVATRDGGLRWDRQLVCREAVRCSHDDRAALRAVSFADADHGYVVGDRGSWAYTTDGGASWTDQDGFNTRPGAGEAGRPGAQADLRAVTLTVPARDDGPPALAVAHAVGPAGRIFWTGGAHAGWQRVEASRRAGGGDSSDTGEDSSGVTGALNGVWFTDHLRGYAVGDAGTIVTTADEGQTWLRQESGTTRDLSAVAFADADSGHAVGADGTILRLTITPPPGLSITAVTPGRGPISGQLPVTITGRGLAGTVEVDFGRRFAYGFVASDGRISAVVPQGAVGTVDVTVTTRGGVSAVTRADQFHYLPPAGGTWHSTASCNRACSGPPLLLSNGQVLVEGVGRSNTVGNRATTTAELYQPDSGTWRLTGAMNVPRREHTATLLHDGRVLVTGGDTDEGGSGLPTTSAELYDPATGRWTPTGSLHRPHASHTATLLKDGRVLVVGGAAGPATGPFRLGAPAELYDPSSGTWSLTGATRRARVSHTANLLRDGRVLVLGGTTGDPATHWQTSLDEATAEVYDPAAGIWRTTGSLSVPRTGFTATSLADGRILVAGGYFEMPQRPPVTVPYAELYDPVTGLWRSTGPLLFPRSFHTASLLSDGRVLVSGGGNISGEYCPCGMVRFPEAYDPVTGGWDVLSPMASPRLFAASAVLDNGSVLVVGGRYGQEPAMSTAAQLFIPPVTETAGVAGPVAAGALAAAALALAVLGWLLLGRLHAARWVATRRSRFAANPVRRSLGGMRPR